MDEAEQRLTHTERLGVFKREAPGGWPNPPAPTPKDLSDAVGLVAAVHPPTPLVRSHQLSQQTSRDIYLKLEGTSAVRSFKYRGALVAVSRIAAESPGKTVVTASTGNHGQGIAYAGVRYGVDVVVCSPETILPEKRAAMEVLGATVEIGGAALTEAEHRAREIATKLDGEYIEDGESADLMIGASTVVAEALRQQPELDCVVVPVGGGNLIAASLLAARNHASPVKVIGVQSGDAPGATMSWLAGEITRRDCNTFAGGLATERPGELSLTVMSQLLETMILVSDDALRASSTEAFRSLGIVVEGAAAAPFVVLERHLGVIEGERIGLIVSGSWLASDELTRWLAMSNS